jgi:N-methylhydantoinase A/oxoprolinase/acetone carboxylase beta subunit
LFSGILSLAVALMHSYTFHEHELKVAEIARYLFYL